MSKKKNTEEETRVCDSKRGHLGDVLPLYFFPEMGKAYVSCDACGKGWMTAYLDADLISIPE